VQHVLSEANSEWTGERGRVSRATLDSMLDIKEGLTSTDSLKQEPTYFCICGPAPFTEAVKRLTGFYT